MKLLGITGSFGKTSTAEIIYQYLLFIGKTVSLYCSNGIFKNGLTVKKDFFRGTLEKKILEENLRIDELNGIECAVIELNAESVKRGEDIYNLPFDVISLTGFHRNLYNNFETQENYIYCKGMLLKGSAKKILLRKEDPSYNLFSHINHITYGLTYDSSKPCIIETNSINGLKLSYQGHSFTTNLITIHHAKNLSCALATIDEASYLNMISFSEFARNIQIRGRIEVKTVNEKKIILDNGYCGADILLPAIKDSTFNYNLKVIYSNVMHSNNNSNWVKNARRLTGQYLMQTKYIYLTSMENSMNEEETFKQDVIDESYINFEYIADSKSAVQKAISELGDKDVLVIFTRNNYRRYKQYLEELYG